MSECEACGCMEGKSFISYEGKVKFCPCECHTKEMEENDILSTIIIVSCVVLFFIILLSELHVVFI